MKTNPSLGENDFVFLDTALNPILVADFNGERWLFLWHLDGGWVTLRRLVEGEVNGPYEKMLQQCALPREQAELYFKEVTQTDGAKLSFDQTADENRRAFITRLRMAGWSQAEALAEWERIQKE